MLILLTPYILTLILSGGRQIQNEESEVQEKIHESKKIIIKDMYGELEVSLEDYIVGVVAAEMPASFETEALKAQAVAARTYTLKKMGDRTRVNQEDLYQSYMSKEKMEEVFGSERYIDYYSKIYSAVEETKGTVLMYEEDYIEAVFHSISGGKTQDASDLWNSKMAYLQSVDSSFDIESPEYYHITTLSKAEIVDKIKNEHEDFEIFTELVSESTQIIHRNDAGYILSIQLGNRIFEGEEIRALLGLRSSNFTLEDYNGNVRIISRGYGHGVGMSQYGANAMAKDSKSYQDILKHYYQGAELYVLDMQ